MTLRRSSLSLEYVSIEVDGGADPTALTVQMAFPSAGVAPVSGDWKTANWDPSYSSEPWLARCLVGPGGTVTLAAGSYDVWIKIGGPSPEMPVQLAGSITIY